MLSLIDTAPMRAGWGQVWQGSELNAIWDHVPTPRVVFSMIGGLELSPSIAVFLEDNNEAILPDAMLLSLVQSAGAFLARGHQVLIHCFEGKFRSTYLDVAVHMAFLKYPYAQAFGRVKQQHPIAEMRTGTEAQLRRLELALHSLD